MGTELDVFKDDAFSVTSMTEAIAKPPYIPGRAGEIIPWNEEGVTTTSIMIEEEGGELALVDPQPRGGPGVAFDDPDRVVRPLQIPHFKILASVMADEVQGVRAFGQGSSVLETIAGRVEKKMADRVQNKLDPTLEYQRVGAVKGVIMKADGTTPYLDLFDAFGVTQEAEVDFDLDNANPATGALRKKCAQVVRTIANNLGNISMGGVHAFCGDAFFDDLLAHPEVVNSYLNTPMAQVLREGYIYPDGSKVYGAFEFGGIVWENYRGSVNGSAFINTDKCHIFPIGVAGLWRTVYAPADWIETVNTVGKRRYARQWEMDGGAGIRMQMQMNTLNFCARPKTLIKGKRT